MSSLSSQPSLSIWIHGSSLGDVNALRLISERLHLCGHQLTVSASTRSGQARWRQLIEEGFFRGERIVSQHKAPLLSSYKAKRALKESGAQLLILELLELWPSWVRSWSDRGVKIIVVDGRISERTLWARPLLRSTFRALSLFLAQTELDAERAIRMGCLSTAVSVCGDGKLDSLVNRQSCPDLHHWERGQQELSFDLLLACVRPRDEGPLMNALSVYLERYTEARILIAPRHIERVGKILNGLQSRSLSASLFKSNMDLCRLEAGVYVLNEYGTLATLYQHAHTAIIGGTFYHQGQSLIEAAIGGCAVIFGPRMSQQRAQVDSLLSGGAHQVNSWEEAFCLALNLRQQIREEVSINLHCLESLYGAVERQLRLIERLIFASALSQDGEP